MRPERVKYGTATQPCELVRDLEGNYFAFESHQNDTRLMWSSTLGFAACLSSFENAFPHFSQSITPESSTVVLHGNDLPIDSNTSEVRETALHSEHALLTASLAYHSIDFTWQNLHKPFHDREFTSMEVGLNLQNEIFTDQSFRRSIERFASSTGDLGLIQSGECEVTVRIDNNLRVIPLMTERNEE